MKRIAPLLVISMLLISSVLNAADTNLNYLIPDLRAWNQVKAGLTVSELEKLLGEPTTRHGPDGAYKPGYIYRWTYGFVAKKSEVFPEDLTFFVNIEMGKVRSKEDPFGGALASTNGLPSVPKLMSPADATVFNHYPRLVDFRWYASSGDYPMKYEIEIDTLYPSGEWSQDRATSEVSVPYRSYAHSGLNRGRWRVRGVNARGKSQWSDYLYFEFTK
jgi:hypothetical protein